MGSKAKVWLISPEGEDWLFKRVRGDAERAEDWPEKVAAELARVFGIPAATVELADYHGQRGVISLSITHGRDLVHGNEMLYQRDPTYERDKPRPEYGYTLMAVREALAICTPPPSWAGPGWTAFEIFAGYLVFDALIANQDRHHENWAVLVEVLGGSRSLAPSFDHASSLGFMLTDTVRQERLVTRDHGRSVASWAARGKSHFEGRPLLVELASQALHLCSPSAAEWWLTQVRRLRVEDWDTILKRLPGSRLSEVARSFASEMLSVNRGRLLDACGGLST